MAKQVNLKRATEDYSMEAYTPSAYPSGLCLYLNEDVCESLGISKALKAGTEITLSARAIVVSATESLERDGDDPGNDASLQLQITDMSATPGGMVRNAAQELYGES